jgi:hypothetical protein
MGSMSFLLPDPLPSAAKSVLLEACLASVGYYDQTPGPTTVQLTPGLLKLTRDENESGYLVIAWPVEPFGTLVISTTTLREREEPYRLLVELARGKLNQVRTQLAEWQSIGLVVEPEFERAIADASRAFGRAVLAPTPSESDTLSLRVLERAHLLADQLVREYMSQMFATRHQSEGPLDTRYAARTPSAPRPSEQPEYDRCFNAASISLRWADIEKSESQYDWSNTDEAVARAIAADLPITLGPVIDLAPNMVPVWARGWSADLPTLAACMCDFLETAINRYRRDVRRWIICAGFNHCDSLGLGDDDRLRLAYRLFEAAAQIDSSLELVLSIAQPWGEYLANDTQTIAPITFPDDLIRAGVRLSAVELEIRAGSQPRGSRSRDLLETARLLDVFGMLGLPIEVVLSYPSSEEPDALAKLHNEETIAFSTGSRPNPDGHAEWGASFASLALAWPQIRSVTWDHWTDAEPHLAPSSGLLDSRGNVKPLLARLRALRMTHLDQQL